MSNEKVNDVEISCKGIDLLVNNDWEGCEKLFNEYKDHSPLLNYCSSFMSYIKALMTFEDALLDKAQKDIENTEKLCSEQNNAKKFSLKKAFGLSKHDKHDKLEKQNGESSMTKEQILEDKFTKAIILADCKLYSAVLTFVRQEVSAYISSGILQIRNSWKRYNKIQKQLYDIYKKLEPNAEKIYGCDPDSNIVQLWIEDTDENDNQTNSKSKNGDAATAANDDEANQAINELIISDEEAKDGLSLEVVKRLLGAVSFGYGFFQICLSFMPPNVLKLIKVFGFEGDRNVAIKAINFTSNSKDMRAPFADMVLLWYSTIAVPMFGISEVDVLISDEDTKAILEKNLAKYSKSSLILYFKGKYERTISKDLVASYAAYELAAKYAAHIREIQQISIYEIGWIHLMNLDYSKAFEQFEILHRNSKWSRSFSTYICAILCGCDKKFSEANNYIKEALKIAASSTRKPNAIEVYGLKRTEFFKKHPINNQKICELLVVELLYLWACISFCSEANLKKMLLVCDEISDKQFVPLKCLFEGAVNIALKNSEFGEQCFNESLARSENEKLGFGKFVVPCVHYELALYYTNEKNYDQAKIHLNKAANYKDFELDNRIQTQIKSLQRRIKYYTDDQYKAAVLKAKAEQELESKAKKQNDINNFYVH